MPEPLDAALSELRPLLLDARGLVKAVAAGRRRGAAPGHARAELRPVELKAGRRVQLVTTDGRTPTTRNLEPAAAGTAIDELLAEPFGSWHVQTLDQVVQLRVTKRGEAQVHREQVDRDATAERAEAGPDGDVGAVGLNGGVEPGAPGPGGPNGVAAPHDRAKQHLIDPADPLFTVLGADAAKRRQVDAFLRQLAPVARRLAPTGRPLRVVDLGCGNAYLTMAAHRYLVQHVDPLTRTLGVDIRPEMAARNTALAAQLGLTGLTFEAAAIEDSSVGAAAAPAASGRADGSGTDLDIDDDAEPGDVRAPADGAEPAEQPAEVDHGEQVDLVLALHACDTATDDALALAVRWQARGVLAAPCCHHDVQRQLSAVGTAESPLPFAGLTRHAILRERFADVLTDAVRADLLRLLGYRVEVVEFIDSAHTPRNALIRAVRTGAAPTARRVSEYTDLVAGWQLRPALAQRLAGELDVVINQALN